MTTADAQPGQLTWALMICTYNRPDMLRRCIRLALEQTRLPAEVVVVDASTAWEESARDITALVRTMAPQVRLVYEAAHVRSITHQRNQALPQVTADIVFAIDDDSLMRRDCAQAVLAIYESDITGEVAGVGIRSMDAPPDEDTVPKGGDTADFRPRQASSRTRRWLQNQLHMDRQFVGYRSRDSLRARTVDIAGTRRVAVRLLNGFRTTFRRSYGVQVGWCEALRYYALHEDADFTYRLSLLGHIVMAPDAFLCHCQAPGGRLPRDVVNKLRVLNLIALHKTFSLNLSHSVLRLVSAYLRTAGLYLIIDPVRRRFTFPTVRAYFYGIAKLRLMLLSSPPQFTSRFNETVEQLVNQPRTQS